MQYREKILCDVILAAEDMALTKDSRYKHETMASQCSENNKQATSVYCCKARDVGLYFYVLETEPEKTDPQMMCYIMEERRWLKLCL
jgi:hypothetical protein